MATKQIEVLVEVVLSDDIRALFLFPTSIHKLEKCPADSCEPKTVQLGERPGSYAVSRVVQGMLSI